MDWALAHSSDMSTAFETPALLLLQPRLLRSSTSFTLALDLRVQNFLIKPYNDDAIYAEIAKGTSNPWRARHFEEENSFCKLMGCRARGFTMLEN